MEFTTYQSFPEIKDAQYLIGVLIENNVEFKVEENAPDINPIFVGTKSDFKVVVKILPIEFERVNELMKTSEEVQLSNIDKDHYLLKFTDEELMEIILKPDEWNNFDYQAAKLLLQERGTKVTEVMETGIKKKRSEELTGTKEAGGAWIIIGYISAFLGGFVGIAIGIYLLTTFKRLGDGTKHYVFIKNNRDHGRAIMIIGIVAALTFLIVRIFTQIFTYQSHY